MGKASLGLLPVGGIAMTYIKELASNVTAAANGAGVWGWLSAATGIFISWLGGWDMPLKVLLGLMVIDYITGVLGAIKLKKLNSDVMFWGGIRKVTVLFVVGIAAMLDDWIQPGTLLFRTAAIYFYVAREGISVVENLGKINVIVPDPVKKFFDQLSQKGGGTDDKNV